MKELGNMKVKKGQFSKNELKQTRNYVFSLIDCCEKFNWKDEEASENPEGLTKSFKYWQFRKFLSSSFFANFLPWTFDFYSQLWNMCPKASHNSLPRWNELSSSFEVDFGRSFEIEMISNFILKIQRRITHHHKFSKIIFWCLTQPTQFLFQIELSEKYSQIMEISLSSTPTSFNSCSSFSYPFMNELEDRMRGHNWTWKQLTSLHRF